LTVDHGLRPEAAEEARWVGDILTARGIRHRILYAGLDKAAGEGRQDRARAARYACLERACVDAGVLHLALAHHRGDQAETVLLRIRGQTAVPGMAGMAAERTTPALRLLRPLLALPKARLEATLRSRGLSWVDDPSNRNRIYLRSRMRAIGPELARNGLDEARLAEIAALIGAARNAIDILAARLLADALQMHPAGFARLRLDALTAADKKVGRTALAQVLACVGGRDRLPRRERLARLYDELAEAPRYGSTLGGCRVLLRGDHLFIMREVGRTPRDKLVPGERKVYDGRYRLQVSADAPEGLEVGPLGRTGWAAVAAARPALRRTSVPSPVRFALPAVFDGDGAREVPALGWLRADVGAPVVEECAFAPGMAATVAGFTVAHTEKRIIS
jgi:tRNA(Ile)-lysidine synthase